MKLILGSSSKWRQQVAREMGLDFVVISPDIDEKAIRDKDPEKLVIAIAKAKNKAIQDKITEPAIIITADQVVTCNGEIREKPVDKSECKYFLQSYAKHPAATVNGVVVTNTKTGKQVFGTHTSKVYFKPIPDDVIDVLTNNEWVMKSAGGFLSEHPIIDNYVKELDGSVDSTMGLPKQLVSKLISEVS